MKARRVLYILRGVEGGLPVVAYNIANGLDRNRFEPIVLFDTHIQKDTQRKFSDSNIKYIEFKKCSVGHYSIVPKPRKNLDISGRIETNFGKETRRIYLSLKDFSKFLSKQAPRINSFARVFQKNRIDLVHTHYNLNKNKPEIIAAWISGIPCVSHVHGYSQFNYFDRMLSRFVDKFVYISRDVAEYHTSQGESRFKGIIIHNGIDTSKYTQLYDPSIVREEFGIKPNQKLVGIIGRIDWWKGHEYFLEAMARTAKQVSGLRGLIIGALEEKVISNFHRNRQYFQKLKLLVNSLGLADKIIFTGSRNDVPRLVAALDVVVHASSIPEPFGLVIVEGMAAGKPVVATAAGGVLDIIEDGVNGLLVPCRDAEAMARAILQIVTNTDKAMQMGMAASQCVAEKFTVQHLVMAVQKLYDDILSHPQRRKKFQD